MSQTKPNKYKNLFSNTLIFAIGSFSSKILVLILVPIYTYFMSSAELGTNDVIVQIANWLIPVITLTISEAVIRFGLDKAYDKQAIFTMGNGVLACGIAVLGVILPLGMKIPLISGFVGSYSHLLFIYVLTSSLKLLYSTFVRALEKVKLYAINGILTTFLTLFFNVLFIAIMRLGVTGYLLAIILSDFCSVLFLLFTARLWKYLNPKKFNKTILKAMLLYSLPLIPTQILWLITNSSDSFMVKYFMGSEANGILTAAYKIPNIVSTIYLMFGQAWNMSAITENESNDRSRFYTKVFDLNQSLMYLIAGGILLMVKPVTMIWIGPDFRESISYAPILIYATVFTCFATFMGTAYIATKNTLHSLATSLISGVINVAINVVFIPRIGIYAAALSTLASYVVVFFIRLYDAKKLIRFDFSASKMIINNIILIFMVFSNYIRGIKSYALLLCAFALIFILNLKCLLQLAVVFVPKRILSKIPVIKKLI